MDSLTSVTELGDSATTFRTLLSNFASGVVVVTGNPDGILAGLAIQSFFSVSLDPPLIAISPSLSSGSWRGIESTGHFAVSVLAESQRELCMTFGRGGAQDKFASAGWDRAPSGAPLIHGALAWLDCSIHAVHPAGDHLLVLGRVEYVLLGKQSEQPLLFFRSRFRNVLEGRRSSADWSAEEVWGSGPWIDGVDW